MLPLPVDRGDSLSATFAALADPTRRAILARLASGEATVSDLAAPFTITPPAVTKHLKVLQRAGLIVQGREKQWRPCRIQPAPLKEATTATRPAPCCRPSASKRSPANARG